MQEITDAFLDFAADPAVSMTFHVDREKLERLLDTAHVVAKFYATNLVWEGFGVGSSFRHGKGKGKGDGRGKEDGGEGSDGEGAPKKPKMDGDDDDKGEEGAPLVPHLAMPYTVEEEKWLRSREKVHKEILSSGIIINHLPLRLMRYPEF